MATRTVRLWRNYFVCRACHLAAGQSIGSGMIEGACKTVVGKRLKQTGRGGCVTLSE